MNREETYQGLTIDDVWGKCTDPTDTTQPFRRLTNGMLVARGLPYEEGSDMALKIQNGSDDKPLPTTCPINNDKLPYKSVSVICEEEQYGAVTYWLEHVHGGGCVSEAKKLDDGKIFLRSNYMCW